MRPFVHSFVLLILLAFAPVAHAVEVIPVRSPGGIEAWLVQVKQIPMLSLEVGWHGGSALDPDGLEGLAEMTAALLDEGAGDLDSQSFHRQLEDRAISLGFNADRDYFRGTLRTLTEHRDEAFRLLGLAMTEPRFDAEPVERIRRAMQVNLVRRDSDPNSVATRNWFAAAFPDHPYGKRPEGTEASLAAIGREHLLGFAQRRLARGGMAVGVVGDIEPEELGRLLDLAFGGLPARAASSEIPDQSPQSKPQPIVTRWDIGQSIVRFGGPGVKRNDPDYYAASLLNYVLGGGGFASRLTIKVREERGLAYSIWTGLQPMEASAFYLGGVATRNDAVAESIRLLQAEMRSLHEQGISAEELSNAKSFMIGSFPLRLTSNAAIAGMLSAIQLRDLGIDFIDRYPDYINAVTLEQVNRVARKLFDPAETLTVIVGQPVGLGG